VLRRPNNRQLQTSSQPEILAPHPFHTSLRALNPQLVNGANKQRT
jgi:hypothetical protein